MEGELTRKLLAGLQKENMIRYQQRIDKCVNRVFNSFERCDTGMNVANRRLSNRTGNHLEDAKGIIAQTEAIGASLAQELQRVDSGDGQSTHSVYTSLSLSSAQHYWQPAAAARAAHQRPRQCTLLSSGSFFSRPRLMTDARVCLSVPTHVTDLPRWTKPAKTRTTPAITSGASSASTWCRSCRSTLLSLDSWS